MLLVPENPGLTDPPRRRASIYKPMSARQVVSKKIKAADSRPQIVVRQTAEENSKINIKI